MSEVHNLVHTYGTKWLRGFKPNFTIVPNHNTEKLQKLEALEENFYARFGEKTYKGFITKIRQLFGDENDADRIALQNFQNDKLRSSLLKIEGQKFNPYQEKFEVTVKISNPDIIGKVLNESIRTKLNTDGNYNIVTELNREGFRQIAKDLFGSKAQSGKKSFKTIEKDLIEGFNNLSKEKLENIFSFKITNGDNTTFGAQEFIESMSRNASKYPWGFKIDELRAADKDQNEKSKLRQELKEARDVIYKYILSLVSGGSQLLQDCVKAVWDQKIGNSQFEKLSFFSGGGSSYMNGVIGALGEFQYAVFDMYIRKKLSSLGVNDPRIVGDISDYNKYNDEKGKTDVEILTKDGLRWGVQVKNYNLFANTTRIPTTIHPKQFVDLIDDVADSEKTDFLTFLANAFFDADYRQQYYDEKEIIKFVENNLGEMLSLTVSNQLTDTVCFYFIGGQNLVPASYILRAAIDSERQDKFLSNIRITGPNNISTEDYFRSSDGRKSPNFTDYWLRDKSSATGWRPRPDGKNSSGKVVGNKKTFNNLVTKSISIKSAFKFRELLEGTSIYY